MGRKDKKITPFGVKKRFPNGNHGIQLKKK